MTAGVLGIHADIFDVVQDLANRIYTLEQAGGFGGVDITGGSVFPGGITIGTGPGTTIVSSAITTPTGLTISSGTFFNEAFIDVSWTNPDTTIATVEVSWAKKVSGVYQADHSDVTGGTALRIQPVNPGSTYGIKIVARNNIGVPSNYVPGSGYTDISVPTDSTIPSAPTGLTLAKGADTIVAKWTEVTDPDVANGAGLYQLQLSHDAFSTIDRDIRVAGSVASFDDIVTNNTTYQVRVRAIDSSNNASSWTISGTFTGGAVDGTDILAHSIAAVKIVANTLTANEILANTITANEIAADAITASELSALALAVGKYIRSNNYVAGVSGWNIDSSGTAEFSNAVIRGSTFTGSLASTTIVGGTITGAFYQSAASTPKTTISTVNPNWAGGGAAQGGVQFDFGRSTTGIVSASDGGTNGVNIGLAAMLGDTTNTASWFGLGTGATFTIPSGQYFQIFGGGTATGQGVIIQDAGLFVKKDIFCDTGKISAGLNNVLETSSFGGSPPAFLNMDIFSINAGTPTKGQASQEDLTAAWLIFFAGSFSAVSSKSLKKNIKNLHKSHGEKLHQLRPVSFQWKHHDEFDKPPEHIGFIAEEVAALWPDLVTDIHERDGKTVTKGLLYNEFIPVMVAEIQKLRKDIDALQGAH